MHQSDATEPVPRSSPSLPSLMQLKHFFHSRVGCVRQRVEVAGQHAACRHARARPEQPLLRLRQRMQGGRRRNESEESKVNSAQWNEMLASTVKGRGVARIAGHASKGTASLWLATTLHMHPTHATHLRVDAQHVPPLPHIVVRRMHLRVSVHACAGLSSAEHAADRQMLCHARADHVHCTAGAA